MPSAQLIIWEIKCKGASQIFWNGLCATTHFLVQKAMKT